MKNTFAYCGHLFPDNRNIPSLNKLLRLYAIGFRKPRIPRKKKKDLKNRIESVRVMLSKEFHQLNCF